MILYYSHINYDLLEKYDRLKKFGDKLSAMKNMIDWKQMRPMLEDLYRSNT